jgi:hypothetical protein
MNDRKPLWNNLSRGETARGDGAYLFDPDGDLRGADIYPCRIACDHPYAGALAIDAQPSGREYVVVRNASSTPVDLFGLRLFSAPHQYAFPEGTVLQPGGSIRVDVRERDASGAPGRLDWGRASAILGDRGDRVAIQTFGDVELACTAWGSASC